MSATGRRDPITEVRPGNWECRWRTPDGKSRQRRGFPTRKAAKAFLVEVLHTKRTGEYVDAGRLTFGEYAEQWRANQVHRGSTAEVLAIDFRRHIIPQLGTRPIGAIKPSEIAAWQKGRLQVLSPAKVAVLRRWVGSIFKAAILDDLIRKSPCVGLPPIKIEPKRVVPMETAAVERLAAAMPERYRALVVFGAGTGVRQGEALGLTVDRVDFLRRTLTVDRQLTGVRGGVPTFGPPKTDASRRTIPLPQVVVDALARHLERFPAGPDGLVFTNTAGRAIRRNGFGEFWHPARKEAGIADGVTFHDLRHYYASLLIAHGASVKVVQARLGHATAEQTLDTYAHLWPDSDDLTCAAVDEVLGGLGGFSCYGEAAAQ